MSVPGISLNKRLHLFADLGLTFVSFHLAILLRQSLGNSAWFAPFSGEAPYKLLFFILPIWAFFLFSKKECYEYRGKSFLEISKNTGVVVLKSFALLLAFLFFTKSLDQSRTLVLIFLLLNFVLLLSFRKFTSHFLSFLRKRGYNYKNILIVGTGSPAKDFICEVKKNPEWGFHISGLLDWEDSLRGKKIHGFSVIGN